MKGLKCGGSMYIILVYDVNFGVRIDIWTHLTRECIINYVH